MRMLKAFVLAAAAGCVWACGIGAGFAQTGSGPLKVGLLASLTGPISFIGDPTHRGAKLAIEQANAAGGINGRKIELVAYDTEGNPDKALTFMKKLITDDKVSVV